MANRLPLFTVLLLLAALLLAAAAHGAPAAQAPVPHTLAFEETFEGEFESDEAEGEKGECEAAREEVAEEELGQDEADEICAEKPTKTIRRRLRPNTLVEATASTERTHTRRRAHTEPPASGNARADPAATKQPTRPRSCSGSRE